MGTCAFLQQGARVLLVVLVQCALKRAEGGEAGKKHYLQKMENGFIAEYFHQLMLSHLLQVRDVYSIVAPMFGRRINFMYCALSMLRVVFNLPCCFLSFLSHRIVVKPCRALGVVPVTGCPLFFFSRSIYVLQRILPQPYSNHKPSIYCHIPPRYNSLQVKAVEGSGFRG